VEQWKDGTMEDATTEDWRWIKRMWTKSIQHSIIPSFHFFPIPPFQFSIIPITPIPSFHYSSVPLFHFLVP
jgi:hypothetical protein